MTIATVLRRPRPRFRRRWNRISAAQGNHEFPQHNHGFYVAVPHTASPHTSVRAILSPTEGICPYLSQNVELLFWYLIYTQLIYFHSCVSVWGVVRYNAIRCDERGRRP
jgi:hypothetical protein